MMSLRILRSFSVLLAFGVFVGGLHALFVLSKEFGGFVGFVVMIGIWVLLGRVVVSLMTYLDQQEKNLNANDDELRFSTRRRLSHVVTALVLAGIAGLLARQHYIDSLPLQIRRAREVEALKKSAAKEIGEMKDSETWQIGAKQIFRCDQPDEPCAAKLNVVVFSVYFSQGRARGWSVERAFEQAITLTKEWTESHFESQMRLAELRSQSGKAEEADPGPPDARQEFDAPLNRFPSQGTALQTDDAEK